MSKKPEVKIDETVTPFGSDDPEEIGKKCAEEISAARAAGRDAAMVTSVKMADRPSENFVTINAQLGVIMHHLRSGGEPEEVCILCPDDETLKQYMVVFNFYYAGSKDERLNDDRWD